VAKAKLRLNKPSSYTPLVSRVAVLDVLWGGISPFAAFLLRDGAIYSPSSVARYCGVSFFVSLLVFQWFQTSSPISRFYSLRDAFELFKACVLIAALSAVAAFLLTRLEDAPRSIPILHFLLLAAGLLGGRVLLRLRQNYRDAPLSEAAKNVDRVLIIQASRLAWFFTKMVEELAPDRYRIVAILDEEPKLKHRSLNGYPIIGAPADLEKVVADYAMHGVRIDKVVLAAQPQDLSPGTWEDVSRLCLTLNIVLQVLPERLISEDAANRAESVVIAHPNALAIARQYDFNKSLDRPFWAFKRGFDLVLALISAVVLSPIAVVVCGLVVLDVGLPIVFWQQRVGRNGAPLHLYKFRTLQTLFDRQTKERRLAQEPSSIGRFLQRTRLDELPQLWNILSGDMSLVGPRPLLPADQPDDLEVRLMVRPGLTGWAQVSGGKLISADEKNALDAWYIRYASLWLDLKIAIRTIWMLLVTGDRRDEKAISIALLTHSYSEVTDLPHSIAEQALGGASASSNVNLSPTLSLNCTTGKRSASGVSEPVLPGVSSTRTGK
jgi:lipopolysaccharide/colanic/teichoic acid biosynthesis glycosyltransferase